MRFFKAVKEYFDEGGVRRPDVWAIVTLVISVWGILASNIGVVGVALFPAFLAGFYLAHDAWDDGPDDEDDPDDDLKDPDLAADYQLYA